ncbi:MAG: MATE family efflux transporter [Bacteroides sp.]|nr:MATE family efflux transporter [Bacteroides sp.]
MAQKRNATELGTQPIGKLLMQYAIPAIIAMTASSIYNMVDSIFIGQGVGPLAISGLAITFPFMNLGAAFGAMVGVGASTLISVKLGQRDYSTAQTVLGNVITLNLIIGIAFSIITLIFLNPILYFFGASADTVGYARDYMEIILFGNVFSHMYFGLNAVLRASGHPQKAMYATINTVVINTILDPIFIYGFGWGIRGAAIATVIAQVISLIWQLRILMDKNELLHLRRGIYHLQSKIVKNIIAIGLSPFCMNVASCFIVIFINKGLKEYDGDLAIGAYGIVNRLVFICVMIVMGITQGMQPIAGYNFGAQQFDRVTRVLKLSIWGATAITTLTFLVGELMPGIAVRLFTTDEGLISRAADGFRIVVLFFPIVGFQMVTSNFFQSIGMANKAIFLSLTRQLLFLLPCLIFLPRFMGAAGIWWSMPISDLVASIVAAVLLYKQMKAFKMNYNNSPQSIRSHTKF